jgi:hypothetical protein
VSGELFDFQAERGRRDAWTRISIARHSSSLLARTRPARCCRPGNARWDSAPGSEPLRDQLQASPRSRLPVQFVAGVQLLFRPQSGFTRGSAKAVVPALSHLPLGDGDFLHTGTSTSAQRI